MAELRETDDTFETVLEAAESTRAAQQAPRTGRPPPPIATEAFWAADMYGTTTTSVIDSILRSVEDAGDTAGTVDDTGSLVFLDDAPGDVHRAAGAPGPANTWDAMQAHIDAMGREAQRAKASLAELKSAFGGRRDARILEVVEAIEASVADQGDELAAIRRMCEAQRDAVDNFTLLASSLMQQLAGISARVQEIAHARNPPAGPAAAAPPPRDTDTPPAAAARAQGC